MAIHLSIGPLKTRSWLEPVPRCEPSTYQPIGLLKSCRARAVLTHGPNGHLPEGPNMDRGPHANFKSAITEPYLMVIGKIKYDFFNKHRYIFY